MARRRRGSTRRRWRRFSSSELNFPSIFIFISSAKQGPSAKRSTLLFTSLGYFSLTEESRQLARVIGERLIRTRKYGLAVAYCVRAGDGRRLGVIADKVLDEYVRNGEFYPSSFVYPLPPSFFLFSLSSVCTNAPSDSSHILPSSLSFSPPRPNRVHNSRQHHPPLSFLPRFTSLHPRTRIPLHLCLPPRHHHRLLRLLPSTLDGRQPDVPDPRQPAELSADVSRFLGGVSGWGEEEGGRSSREDVGQ
jgi:hypothetical protein